MNICTVLISVGSHKCTGQWYIFQCSHKCNNNKPAFAFHFTRLQKQLSAFTIMLYIWVLYACDI